MVVTRNTSLESHVDDSVKNWVTEHEGRGEGTSSFTRLGKLEFPKFFGDDVKGWLYRVKQFFAVPMFMRKRRFGLINEDQMAELKNLRYGTNMKDYQSQIEQLLTQVDVTQSQLVSLFIVGLPTNIEVNVRMFRPKTLVDAMSLANFQEASLVIVKNRTTPLLPTPKTNPPYYAYRNVNYPTNSTTLALPAPTNQLVTKHPAITEVPPRK
ncbi:hypothetical protein Tco_1471930 [Tanacetum coccineum]